MTFVSESAIRNLIKESLQTPTNLIPECEADCPVLVNPSLDNPLSRVDGNIFDVEFVPHDVNELEITIRQMIKNFPEEAIPELYKKMRSAIEDEKNSFGDKELNTNIGDMSKMSDSTVKLGKTEAMIRNAVRKALQEAGPSWKFNDPVVSKIKNPKLKMGLGGQFTSKDDDNDPEDVDLLFNPDNWDEKEPADLEIGDRDDVEVVKDPSDIDTSDVDADTASDWDPEPVAKEEPKKKGRKKLDHGTGEGSEGVQLADIAKEMGISPSGVRRLMDTGLAKAEYMSELGPQEAAELVLDAADEYIQMLGKSGELTKDDVNFLYKHIDMVAELDGFREFLHKHVRNSMKADGEWVYDKDDEA